MFSSVLLSNFPHILQPQHRASYYFLQGFDDIWNHVVEIWVPAARLLASQLYHNRAGGVDVSNGFMCFNMRFTGYSRLPFLLHGC